METRITRLANRNSEQRGVLRPPANHRRPVCDASLSAVLVLLLFPRFFLHFRGRRPPLPPSPEKPALNVNLIVLPAEGTADPAPSTDQVHISPLLKPSSADIERRRAADPRPPKLGEGREGGRWRSGWRPERIPEGLADRATWGFGLAVPHLTKTPRTYKCKDRLNLWTSSKKQDYISP